MERRGKNEKEKKRRSSSREKTRVRHHESQGRISDTKRAREESSPSKGNRTIHQVVKNSSKEAQEKKDKRSQASVLTSEVHRAKAGASYCSGRRPRRLKNRANHKAARMSQLQSQMSHDSEFGFIKK